MDRASDREASLEAYPNVRAAASLIGVSASTLSRRADLSSERRGDRDLVLRADEVLRLAVVYRKRSLNDVAQGLIEYAKDASPDEAGRVEEEVEAFFEGREIREGAIADFLSLARQLLPDSLYREVEQTLTPRDPLPEGIFGDYPRPDS